MRTYHSKYRKKIYPDVMNQVEKFYPGDFLNAYHFLLIVLKENCISDFNMNLTKCIS